MSKLKGVRSEADFIIAVSNIVEKTKLRKKEAFEDLLLEAFKIGYEVARLDINSPICLNDNLSN